MDMVLLPREHVELGDEIARGSLGPVHDAVLYGARVCVKVRRAAWPTALAAVRLGIFVATT